MERNVVQLLLSAVLLLCGTSAKAQTESGLLLGVEAEKTVSKSLSVTAEAGFRSRNDFKTADRWSGSVGVEYKLTKGLKAAAGYTLLYDNYREKITDNYWRPSYWGVRHRVNASLTGSYKVGSVLRLSLRERWQYTYRPETTTDRFYFVDYPGASWTGHTDGWTATEKVRDAKGKNQLRSRLQVEYDKKKATVKPYASAELYNSWEIEKVRYTVGTDVKLSKQHSLDIYYRFQDQRHVDEGDYVPDMNYLGVSYKYKF